MSTPSQARFYSLNGYNNTSDTVTVSVFSVNGLEGQAEVTPRGFFGVISDEIITSVEVKGHSDSGEIIDNLAFGNPIADTDGDGTLDDDDACTATPEGEVVDEAGCSITQLCPCDDPWKSHGRYVLCVAHAAEDFLDDNLISEEEKDAIISEARRSDCGKKNK